MKKIFFLLAIIAFFQPVSAGFSAFNQNEIPSNYLESSMDLNVVFTGFDSDFIDTNQVQKLLQDQLFGVPYKTVNVGLDLSGVGTISRVYWNFNLVFTTTSFNSDLNTTAYNSAQLDNVTNKTGLYIDTDVMREFVQSSMKSVSALQLPTNGYTLVLANLSSLGNHWYRSYYRETDTNQQLNRSFLNSFSVDRLFFIDLSVQGSYLERFGSDGPIQDLVLKYSPNEAHGKYMISAYFRDWITESIYDLFVSNPVYASPNFYETWDISDLENIRTLEPNSTINIDLYLMNNITGNTSTDFLPFINKTTIHDAFADLIPWYKWNVNLKQQEVKQYPSLWTKLKEFTDLSKNETFNGRQQGSVDMYGLYDWMFNEIGSGNATKTLPFLTFQKGSIPVFLFTFDTGIFGVPYKTVFREGILGAALFQAKTLVLNSVKWSPLIFITQDYENFARSNKSLNNFGFTHTIIHEVGHAVSLSHPHGFSWATSMLEDPMSYISYPYKFSVFKKDQARRTEVELTYRYARAFLNPVEKYLSSYESSVMQTDYNNMFNKYSKMDYISAYPYAWNYYLNAKTLYNSYKAQITQSIVTKYVTIEVTASQSSSSPPTSNFSTISIGLALGVISIVAFGKRRRK